MSAVNKIQKADLDWGNLPFDYMRTDCNIRYFYKDGKWSDGELFTDDTVSMNIAAPVLHYGQEAFEGLKAFTTADGRTVVFRPGANAKRLQRSCERLFIPEISEEVFIDAVRRVVKANERFVPPYGTGASLYIRPVVFGTGARVGLGPAEEYIFVVFACPVGPYYKGGFKPVRALVLEDFDRAAPRGVGDCKVGGNYAAGISGGQYGKKRGYPVVLYLDPAEKKYIDEFSTSNFIAIKGSSYLSPTSHSILPSITNDSLACIAESIGMKVEKRPVEVSELAEIDEVGAVGTAAVITPVNLITYRDRDLTFGDGENAGPVIKDLYDRLTKIQCGDMKDDFEWLYEVE